MSRLRVRRALLLILTFGVATDLSAQAGAITGRVTNSEGGFPVQGARVQAVNSGGQIAASVLTRDDGNYRVANLAPGAYSVVVSRIGFGLKRTEGVSVTSGGTATLDVVLTQVVTELNPIVTTASRRPEKALEAPASISVVDVRDIQERPSVTVADHLKGMAGVDIQQGGVAQSNVVARGFNNAFSGSILTLQDYRFAAVPSLRVNVPFLMTATNEDIERVEVLLGPASALYGPNSANGVLHIITKSPFSSQGTTLTIDGGERSMLRGSLRTAGLFTPKLGYKLSGEYFSANDFDSETARDTLGRRIVGAGGRTVYDPGEPDVFPSQAPAGRAGQPNVRDFDLNRYAGEARIDYRPGGDAEFVTSFGYTKILSGLEFTGANGTSQVKNWTYKSIQQRMRIGRLFGQLFLNNSNAGNEDSLDTGGTFLLRSGQPIVDQSRVFAAQLQHGISFAGDRQDFVYGLDYIFTNPRTGGTINGRNEDIDDVTEVGGYVQSTTRLSPKFDVIAALRLDNNDQIDGNQFSPRAALVFKPTPTHNLRATYNRAFSTPANFSYFLDLIQARNIGGTGFNVRALGNPPKTGWTFNRSCTGGPGGLCMKSPATGAANPWVPAVASPAAFPVIVGALGPTLRASLQASLQAAGTPAAQAQQLAAGIVQFLGTLRPTGTDAGSRIAFLGASPTTSISESAITPIGPLDASYNKTIELGYKGIISNRVRLAVDAWFQKRGDVGNPAGLATPNVFYNPTALGGFIGPRLGPFLSSLGLPAAQVQALVAALTPALAGGLSSVPQGIVQFNSDRFASATDVHATYTSQSDKEFDVNGLDVALDIVASDKWTIAGTYSWVSEIIFEDIVSSNNTALMLNAPGNKGSLALKFRDELKGLGFEVRTRYHEGYPVNSGVYAAGDRLDGRPIRFTRPGSTTVYEYDRVEDATVFDVGFNYRLPFAGAREAMFSLNGTNIFDKGYRTMPGAPLVKRMIVTRLQYSF
ncbi:MAG: TonB-dependent receptor domain-containing protein [Gemmatimonadaceae bacterium]